MKILFFYESCDRGGQQTYTLELIKTLKEQGHQVEYMYCQDSEAMLLDFESVCKVTKLKTLLSPGEYKYKPWKLWFISREIKFLVVSSAYDVVISGSGIGSFLVGRSLKRLSKLHYRLIGCSLKQVEKNLYRYYKLLRVDHFIDGYFGWDEVLRELEEKGVEKKKFIKTPFGVNTSTFSPIAKEEVDLFKSSLNLSKDKLVIGWVGRICKTMQVWGTVDLAESLLKLGFNDFQLLFVGGGPDEDSLFNLLQEKNLLERSVITGWVDYKDMNKYYNIMDVVPLLSDDPQGGSIIREAMAVGKFTISVDGPSKTQDEIMKSNFSALVPPKDFAYEAAKKIIMLHNKGLINPMGKLARDEALRELSFFKVAKIINQTISLQID